MKGLVHRRVPPARVGVHAVLAEAGGGVVVRSLDHDVHPPAKIPGDRPAVALERRHHLDLALVVKEAALLAGAEHVREIVHAAGREAEALGRRREPRRVRDRGHLEGRLGPVEEGVEHLEVHSRRPRLLRGEAVVLPYGVGSGGVVARKVLGALAGGYHVEPGAARPVDQLAGEGRLVPVGHRVDHPGPLRLESEQRASEDVRLDVHHHDVLGRGERGAGMADPRLGPSGGFHDHVDIGARRKRGGVVGEGRFGDEGVAPAGGAAGGPGPIGLQVGDRGDPQPGGGRSLAEEHRAELAGPDEPDPHRLRRLGPPEKIHVQVHDGMVSMR